MSMWVVFSQSRLVINCGHSGLFVIQPGWKASTSGALSSHSQMAVSGSIPKLKAEGMLRDRCALRPGWPRQICGGQGYTGTTAGHPGVRGHEDPQERRCRGMENEPLTDQNIRHKQDKGAACGSGWILGSETRTGTSWSPSARFLAVGTACLNWSGRCLNSGHVGSPLLKSSCFSGLFKDFLRSYGLHFTSWYTYQNTPLFLIKYNGWAVKYLKGF